MTAVTGAWAQTWGSGDCTVTLSEGVMTVSGTGAMANYAKSSATPWYSDLTDVETVVIESGVTSIGDNAFYGCTNLESVSIPASVTSIGENAFSGCGSVAAALTVSFAEGSTLESIGEFAFNESILKSIDIPNSVTSIGGGAFNSCYILAKVNIFASYLTTYGAGAFEDNADGRKIYVHPDAVDTYKAGWPDYADDIEAMTLYATSVKEGTEDAENWSATPSQPTAGQKVTINYAGTKSVKSVTAKRKATTGNITVYFTDALNWGNVHVYYWNDGGEWPGTAMTEVGTNDYNQKIYRAEIPATAVGIIFNGNGKQTVDNTDNIEDGSWWYTTNEYEGTKNKVAYVDMCPENIEVTNVDDNKWTFTMPNFNVELDIEYYPAHPVTINDGDIDAANWSATPTEQSVGQKVTLQYTGRKKIKRITIEAAPTARTAAEATAEDLGKVIGADGNIYDSKDAAVTAGTTAVAMIAYVGSSTDHATYTHGLAIALADESNSNWSTAKSTCEGKSAVTNAAWLLPSQNQWKAMFGANGGNEGSYSGLNTALANAGGTALQGSDGIYWTSTDSGYAYSHFIAYLNGGSVNFWADDDTNSNRVRACLAF